MWNGILCWFLISPVIIIFLISEINLEDINRIIFYYSDCRQTPKFGVLFTVFLFYTHCINYSGSDSNDEKTID